ncbi:MAG: hypothetical protein ACI910_000009 [Oleispira sp.]
MLFYDTSGFILEGHSMLGEKDSLKGNAPVKDTNTAKDTNTVKGNEAEEFIKRIVVNVLFTGVMMVVGVGIAIYYISGAV